MLGAEQWQIVAFTVAVASGATLLLAPPAIAIALLLARRDWRGKIVVETAVTLPLVMPPVATGLLLLELFARNRALGATLSRLGLDVIFTWRGVLIAMMTMSAPLLVRSARVAFEDVDHRAENMARLLGAGEWRVFFSITLPLALRGVISGCVLAFARCVGEFGATVLVAGNIPGRTTTLSVAIFDAVQIGDDGAALRLVLVAVAIAFCAVLASELLAPRHAR